MTSGCLKSDKVGRVMNECYLKGKKKFKYVHGYVSGKMAIMLKKSPGSERVEYALKVPRIPSRIKEA